MRVLDAEQVRAATPWSALLDTIAGGVADGGITAPDRQVLTFEPATGADGSLLLMPAWTERASDDGLLGVKVVTYVPGNTDAGRPTIHATYLAFDRTTGEPLAVLDGDALTARRTAAVSALAARLLAPRGARRLLVIGAGQLLSPAISAHVASSDIATVEVWGRDIGRTAAACAALTEAAPVSVVADVAEAAARADVIVCLTAATAPVLRGAWLREGTHVNLLGSFRADMRESDVAVLRRGSVFVDTVGGALLSGDLQQPIAAGEFTPEDLAGDLADLCTGRHPGRRSAEEITVFKSVGFAGADLMAARLVLRGGTNPTG
jgi:ornithine cyclodeaminase